MFIAVKLLNMVVIVLKVPVSMESVASLALCERAVIKFKLC